MHDFYGAFFGLRFARKHLAWYADGLGISREEKRAWMMAETREGQLRWFE
jgi:hypothetical protein